MLVDTHKKWPEPERISLPAKTSFNVQGHWNNRIMLYITHKGLGIQFNMSFFLLRPGVSKVPLKWPFVYIWIEEIKVKALITVEKCSMIDKSNLEKWI